MGLKKNIKKINKYWEKGDLTGGKKGEGEKEKRQRQWDGERKKERKKKWCTCVVMCCGGKAGKKLGGTCMAGKNGWGKKRKRKKRDREKNKRERKKNSFIVCWLQSVEL